MAEGNKVFKDYPEIEWGTEWSRRIARAFLEAEGDDAVMVAMYPPGSSADDRIFDIIQGWMLGKEAEEVEWQ